MKEIIKKLLQFFTMFALYGCIPHTTLEVKQISMPQWVNLPPADNAVVPISDLVEVAAEKTHWWRYFNDPQLDKVLSRAINESPDIMIAQAKIEQIRALSNEQIAQLLPAVGYNLYSGRTQNSLTQSSSVARQTKSNEIEASVDWNVGIFSITPSIKAAQINADMSIDQYNATLLTMVYNTADLYFLTISLKKEIDYQKKKVRAMESAIKLAKDMQNAGKTSGIEYNIERIDLAQEIASLAAYEASYKSTLYGLEAILGQVPESLKLEVVDYDASKDVLGGIMQLPADVLAARPDVQFAYKNIYYNTALKDIAVSQFFPNVSIQGLFGAQSKSLGSLFKGISSIWSINLGFFGTIMDFGIIKAKVEFADAATKEAVATYEKTLFAALSNVETALVKYNTSLLSYNKLNDARKVAQEQLALIRQRYDAGMIGYLDVITAEIAYYNAAIAMEQSKYALTSNIGLLYTAIGSTYV